MSLTLDELFSMHDFSPNEGQREAIETLNGPLFLMAGPGSGKTRVLLWRTVNAIVFHNIEPEKIFLSTFTEKAAKQLKDGLQSILGTVTNETGVPYDLSKMYVGTVHSLCQRLIADRRMTPGRSRVKPPILLDEIDQYFHINSARFWQVSEEVLHIEGEDFREEIKMYFGKRSSSKHETTLALISLFNRLSEENIPLKELRTYAEHQKSDTFLKVVRLYEWYRNDLENKNIVDFALLQKKALDTLEDNNGSSDVFSYVVIDEFQDTNRIQEQVFFKLASGHKNLCVVGDDDQALYRFRGATVENFVEFPTRCNNYLSQEPKAIRLNINYRSRKHIVETYTSFIENESWVKEDGEGYYRLKDKDIKPHDQDYELSVFTTTPSPSENVVKETASFVRRLLDENKVENPNQIAFLFPSLKNNKHVRRMKQALEAEGIGVYAPRAGKFLEVDEAKAIFGAMIQIFGKPERQEYGGEYKAFHNWLDSSQEYIKEITKKDERLQAFIDEKNNELMRCQQDYIRLLKTVTDEGWSINDKYNPKKHKRPLVKTPLLSKQTIKGLGTQRLDNFIEQRMKTGNPFTIKYILNRATSVDWNLLDIFYRLTGFPYFSQMFKLAQDGKDEGPICNLSMISEYLSRYMEQTQSVISGARLLERRLGNDFFGRYIYGLYRIGESEVENEETPFPKGRVPFLTIHQSKGLEFPYVVLGTAGKKNYGVPIVEEIVRPIIDRESEPLSKIPRFDTMRLFYVALSRAEQGLVITNLRGRGQVVDPAFKKLFEENSFPLISDVNVTNLPKVSIKEDDIPKVYSYTSDYLLYLKCPRNYMAFKKYGFVPSRTQTMLFGTLIHQTIEDLHNHLISLRSDEDE
ncbi:UvrD-helicase domain-containing protein [Halobacillus litoralis]|uniref:UvrD-helicase domain-containing protein n=1 Tax=Halobacillus litoralis TaxID=45668 RepID=UPI001CD1A085|nr:ATP-dependent helicase [Halobacillus litoralis]MCA1022138.1 ATP-dependent helicase [Halobacillus litoralis]